MRSRLLQSSLSIRLAVALRRSPPPFRTTDIYMHSKLAETAEALSHEPEVRQHCDDTRSAQQDKRDKPSKEAKQADSNGFVAAAGTVQE